MNQPPVIPPCANNPHHPTDWVCTGCGKGWCDQCISRIGMHNAFEVCPSCFERCERLDDILSGGGAERRKKNARSSTIPRGGWLGMVLRAITLPFKPPGIILITIAGVVFGVLQVLLSSAGLLGFLAMLVVYGYVSQFWLELIRAEANGDEAILDPALDREGLGHGLLMLFLAVPAILFGPGFLAHLMQFSLVARILWGAGAFLAPMALIAIALYDTGWALNPVFLVQSIFRVLVPYFMLCLVYFPFIAGAFILEIYPVQMLPRRSITLLFAWQATKGILQLYLLWVAGRLLGGFYRLYEESIGWGR